MKRYLALIGAAVLAVSSSLGSISAQTGIPVNADGSYVVANDDSEPIVSGVGEDIDYGDVSTGGAVVAGDGRGSGGRLPHAPRPRRPSRRRNDHARPRRHGRHGNGDCSG